MKKAGVLAILLIIVALTSQVVFSQAEDTTKIDKAYACALDKAKGKCKDLGLEEQTFALLALSYQADVQEECKKAIIDNGDDNKCWPKGSCKLRDTALAVLSLDYIGTDVSGGVNWLLNKNSTPKDLIWYLQIDANEETSCRISYNGKDFNIVMKDDKTLTQSAGSCLTRAQGNYWLQIASGCLETTFTVSCDKNFISNLIYKKTNSNVYYISSDTKSGSAPDGKTENKVESTCFGSPCDYEGSLWATLALMKSGKDITPFLPYLNALATDNEKFLPSAFLHIFTGDEEHFSKLASLHAASMWDVKSGYGKYYDTALALLSLQNTNSEQATESKDYMLANQPSNGCWQNSLRDTSFILYAAWPKNPAKIGGITETYCKDFNYFCITPGECAEAGGEEISSYFCPSLSAVCCNKAAAIKTCSDKGGKICADNEECTGNTIEASDSSRCCDSSCEEKQTQPDCEIEGYFCQASCSDNQEPASYSCTGGDVCCKNIEITPSKKSYWWIWLLVILIILVILGIIFRDRLRVFIFKFKKGKKSGPPTPGAPSGPGGGPRPMMGRPPTSFPPRFTPPSGGAMQSRGVAKPPVKVRPSAEDKELDETLKKLKEISK